MRACVVVTDWDGIGWSRLAPVLAQIDKLGGDWRAWEDWTTKPNGREIAFTRLTFDANRVRDSWVHGWVCDAGYVAHIDPMFDRVSV